MYSFGLNSPTQPHSTPRMCYARSSLFYGVLVKPGRSSSRPRHTVASSSRSTRSNSSPAVPSLAPSRPAREKEPKASRLRSRTSSGASSDPIALNLACAEWIETMKCSHCRDGGDYSGKENLSDSPRFCWESGWASSCDLCSEQHTDTLMRHDLGAEVSHSIDGVSIGDPGLIKRHKIS